MGRISWSDLSHLPSINNTNLCWIFIRGKESSGWALNVPVKAVFYLLRAPWMILERSLSRGLLHPPPKNDVTSKATTTHIILPHAPPRRVQGARERRLVTPFCLSLAALVLSGWRRYRVRSMLELEGTCEKYRTERTHHRWTLWWTLTSTRIAIMKLQFRRAHHKRKVIDLK